MSFNVSNQPSPQQEIYSGLSVNLIPAPFGKRALAYIVDISIIGALSYAAFFLLFFIIAGGFGGIMALQVKLSQGAALGMMILVGVAVLLGGLLLFDGFFIYFEYKKGATPGKKLCGLMVVPLKTGRLTLGQCIWREAFRHIDALFGVFALPGVIAVNVTQNRQRIGDLVAGTMVVYSNYKVKAAECMYLGLSDWNRLNDQLSPGAIATPLRREYLAFAYPYYIMGTSRPNEEKLAHWEHVVNEQLPRVSAIEISRDLKLRFFAELCLRRTNEK